MSTKCFQMAVHGGAIVWGTAHGLGFDFRFVTGIFHFPNLSGHIVALDSAKPLTEMITGNISWRIKMTFA